MSTTRTSALAIAALLSAFLGQCLRGADFTWQEQETTLATHQSAAVAAWTDENGEPTTDAESPVADGGHVAESPLLDACDRCDSATPCGCGATCADWLGCGSSRCCDRHQYRRYCGKGRLLGVFAPTDPRFNNFISPMTNPVYFEDPRNLTEARAIFLDHDIPTSVLGGGHIQLVAVQLRAALTDRLSVIATKDGYIFNGNGPPINGWADINLGLKYNLYADALRQRLLSVGTRYAMPTGTPKALQGLGDGQFDLFLSGGTQLGKYSHFLSNAGFRLACNPSLGNDQFWWSNHLDRRLANIPLYGLLELNWYNYLSNGTAGVPGLGGLDLYNLGSSGIAGNNVVTGAGGIKYKPTINSELGVCYEVPLTGRRDIINGRLTVDLILRY